MPQEYETRAKHIRDDHYLHWLALLVIAWWAGSVFGWLLGLATLAGVYLAIVLTNAVVMSAGGSFSYLKLSRWGWLAVAVIIIVLAGAETGSVAE